MARSGNEPAVSDDLERESLQLYLQLQNRRDDLVATIHPADQMYGFIRAATSSERSDAYCRFQYFLSGYELLLSLQNVLQSAGSDIHSFESILEFACGYGRLTRYLVQEVPRERISISEIQHDAVDHVSSTFGVHGFVSGTEAASVHFDKRYDLIYVVSLFSHLPRKRFEEWLTRLYELLTPDGLLVFSTHGESLGQGHQMDPSGFTYVSQSEISELDTEEYGVSFVSPTTVASIAQSCGVAQLYTVQHDLAAFQDLYAATNRVVPGLVDLQRTSLIKGYIDHIIIGADGKFEIDGWAADARDETPLAEVRLRLDGHDAGLASLGLARADLAGGFWSRSDWVRSGWHCTGVLPSTLPGPHILSAEATSSTGRKMCFDMRHVEL